MSYGLIIKNGMHDHKTCMCISWVLIYTTHIAADIYTGIKGENAIAKLYEVFGGIILCRKCK
jgi:hypothetical protein